MTASLLRFSDPDGRGIVSMPKNAALNYPRTTGGIANLKKTLKVRLMKSYQRPLNHPS
jgi:hypothetical protein